MSLPPRRRSWCFSQIHFHQNFELMKKVWICAAFLLKKLDSAFLENALSEVRLRTEVA
jgi:hypothetical protein